MTKIEDYSKALELLDTCCKRNELIRIAENMGEDVSGHLDKGEMRAHNAKDVVEAIELVGVENVREFVIRLYRNNHPDKELEQAYINGGAVDKLYI